MTRASNATFALSVSTRRSTRLASIGREGAIQPRRSSTEYEASRALLNPDLLLELELIEEAILVDPDGRLHRRERADGSIVDYSQLRVGLLVAYDVDAGGRPFFLDIRDLSRR